MPVSKPYYRTARQFVNGNYYGAGEDYIVHPSYAVRPQISGNRLSTGL
jgi:hypothetical protein